MKTLNFFDNFSPSFFQNHQHWILFTNLSPKVDFLFQNLSNLFDDIRYFLIINLEQRNFPHIFIKVCIFGVFLLKFHPRLHKAIPNE